MRKDFKAHCRITELVDGKPTGCGVPTGLDFTDAAEYDAHMAQVHGRKLGMVWIGYEPPRVHQGKFATKQKTLWESAPGPTRPPRKGLEPFTPKPFEPGVDVSWRELVETGKVRVEERWSDERTGQFVPERRYPATEWIERTGQVWSLGGYPKSFWVVPYLPWRDELAVLLKPSLGELRVCQVWPRSEASRAAA